MTLSKSDALVSRPGRSTRGRVALAVSQALLDSKIRPQVVPFGSQKIAAQAPEDYFDTLLKQDGCQKAWDRYIDPAGFPQDLFIGAVPLNGFRHYMLQDAIYLEYYVRVRMAAVGTWDSKVSSNELWDFAATIPDGLGYSKTTRSICENQLGIPSTAVDDEWQNHKSTELETSIRHYESVIANDALNKGNSWLDIHFALLPCIKGYYTIAKALLKSNRTIRNMLYYSLWIEANADETYVEEYDSFIKNNIGTPTSEQWAHWGRIFKKSCENERAFFNLALKNFPKYDIVPQGKYMIHPFALGTTWFLAGNDKNKVVVSSTPTQWELINSPNGYILKLADNKFLGRDGFTPSIRRDDIMRWSINPVFIPGYNTYQLFMDAFIEFALDVDTVKNVSLAKDNLTSQVWILAPA